MNYLNQAEDTADRVREILERDSLFIIRSIQILHRFHTFISIYEFQIEYINTFDLDFTPLLHSQSNRQKAQVLSALPYVKVKEFLGKDYLEEDGVIRILKVLLHR